MDEIKIYVPYCPWEAKVSALTQANIKGYVPFCPQTSQVIFIKLLVIFIFLSKFSLHQISYLHWFFIIQTCIPFSLLIQIICTKLLIRFKFMSHFASVKLNYLPQNHGDIHIYVRFCLRESKVSATFTIFIVTYWPLIEWLVRDFKTGYCTCVNKEQQKWITWIGNWKEKCVGIQNIMQWQESHPVIHSESSQRVDRSARVGIRWPPG